MGELLDEIESYKLPRLEESVFFDMDKDELLVLSDNPTREFKDTVIDLLNDYEEAFNRVYFDLDEYDLDDKGREADYFLGISFSDFENNNLMSYN